MKVTQNVYCLCLNVLNQGDCVCFSRLLDVRLYNHRQPISRIILQDAPSSLLILLYVVTVRGCYAGDSNQQIVYTLVLEFVLRFRCHILKLGFPCPFRDT